MLAEFSNSTTIIRHVSLRYSGPDRLAAELRAAALLRTASFTANSLPPSAILCIRRVRDPMRRQLRLDAPLRTRPLQWEAALARTLSEISRSAARASLGAVDENAPAVWFA